MELLTIILYIVFVLSALVLTVVILLQEGKGGGLGDALGAAGQQAVGFKASGIHKFTATVAVIFVCTAVGIHMLNKSVSEQTVYTGDEGVEANPNPVPAGGSGEEDTD